jgi:4-hydroxy-tetrahydrodipicolinate synthase
MSLRTQLQGTGVALVTPFKTSGDVDFNALGKVLEFVIAGGVEYVVTLGTTGETPTLDKREREDIIQYTFEKVNNRVPVVVGVGGNNTKELVTDLHSFPLDRAVAVLSTSPYYSKPSQEGIFQHYKLLAQESPKPVIIYNIPGRTGRNVTATTIMRLAHEVPGIGGVKEASGDMQQCMEILRDRPEDFLVVSGDDSLSLPQIACGMDGVISVAANTFPEQVSEIIRLALKGDFRTARKLHYQFLEAYDYLFAENNPAGVKAFMYELGLLENVLRLPVVPVSDGLQQQIKRFLSEKI